MIAPEIEAFLPTAEISSEHHRDDPSERRREGPSDRRREDPSELIKVGDVVTASVIRVQKKPRRIEISVRKHDQKEERRLLKHYRDSGEGVSLADVTGWGRTEETADKPGDATPS
jgi:ribosomal protein S1